MAQLHEIQFANLVVNGGIVHSLKTIVCLLTNPHYPIQPILLALRANTNFSADDDAAPFIELFSSLEASPIVMCSAMICPLNLTDLIEFRVSRLFCT
jgi:hypothetical protein